MKILLCICFLYINISYASLSFYEAQQIYTRLTLFNGVYPYPKLVLNPSLSINAWSSQEMIQVSWGTLLFSKNEHELARVLGHELGHYVLHHNNSSFIHELKADNMAMIYMSKVGYDKCMGAQLLYRRNSKGGVTHPPDRLRYKRFHCEHK